jgi:hypothetical protein
MMMAVGRRVAFFLAFAASAAGAGAAAVACSSSSSSNPHDNVIDNTGGTPTATAPQDAAPPPGFPIMFDSGYYDSGGGYDNKPDGFAPLAICSACNCSYNGASAPPPPTDDSGAAGDAGAPPGPPGFCVGALPGDFSPPASCAVTGTALALGCNAVPAACAGLAPKEACPCVLAHVSFGCYANCAVQGGNIVAYCPNP